MTLPILIFVAVMFLLWLLGKFVGFCITRPKPKYPYNSQVRCREMDELIKAGGEYES